MMLYISDELYKIVHFIIFTIAFYIFCSFLLNLFLELLEDYKGLISWIRFGLYMLMCVILARIKKCAKDTWEAIKRLFRG